MSTGEVGFEASTPWVPTHQLVPVVSPNLTRNIIAARKKQDILHYAILHSCLAVLYDHFP